MSERAVTVQLTSGEIALLIEALDSHEYWQLSESHERNDGCSTVEDGEREEVDAVRTLASNLERQPRCRLTPTAGLSFQGSEAGTRSCETARARVSAFAALSSTEGVEPASRELRRAASEIGSERARQTTLGRLLLATGS